MARIWRTALLVGAGALLTASCSSGGGGGESTSADDATTTSSVAEETTTSAGMNKAAPTETTEAPRAGRAGLFDFNQDGSNEQTCGQADFKAGLVVLTYCDDLSGYLSDPEAGGIVVKGSLITIPGPPDDPRDQPITSGASVQTVHLEGVDHKEVVVLTLSSDTVFAVGSDKLADPAVASLEKIAAGIVASYPKGAVQVRGHTDSTGSAAANQSLSERRAATVAAFFGSHGIANPTSVGLGQTVPNYQEKNADGTDSTVGRNQNRRIEVVIRL